MREEEAINRVRKAHRLVVKAANCWNAGKVAAVEECAAALEESAAELRAAEAAAAVRGNSLQGIRSEILQMKERVMRIERLSEVAAQFLRAGQGSVSDSPLYGATGLAETDSSFHAKTIIQA